MSLIAFEIVLIFFLLLLNGVFAMTEIAIVSARKARLKQEAENGHRGAALALELSESPNRFLSTVQIGITLVGIVAGAFGGANLADRLAEPLQMLPWIGLWAKEIAFAIVVGLLTYFSLVIGELAPKRLAMRRPEAISMAMARPMHWISTTAGPAVRFLGWSTDAILRLFGIRHDPEKTITREEVSVLVREGTIAGELAEAESKIIEGVLSLDEVHVNQILTPRPKLHWVEVSESHEEVWHKLVAANHLYFPVYESNWDNLVGVVSIKTLYAQLAAGVPVNFRDLAMQPLLVPEHQHVMQLLEEFQKTRIHVAVVLDEFGGTVGMVTLSDVMEAIVGELPSREDRTRPEIVQRQDGSFLVDGLVEITRVAEQLPDFATPEGAGEEFNTIAGLVIARLERWPKEGDSIEHGCWTIEVVDMDGQRVDKLVVRKQSPVPAANHGSQRKDEQ